MKIGVGITTHNRREVFNNTLKEIKKHSPSVKIVTVDDASDDPVRGATFRFESNVGIARAKNKCLELLEDCDEIFLFDDDTYPIVDDWWKPYVESPEPHLMYIFKDFINKEIGDCIEVYRDARHVAYSHARGCMLYINCKVLDEVGGMNVNYGRWGNEHIDWSNRIHNAGLTSFRFADTVNSSGLFYSGDENVSVTSTVGSTERRQLLQKSQELVNASRSSSEYCDYKENLNDVSNQTNVILTSYFTGSVDPQRGEAWDDNQEVDTQKLINSANTAGVDLVILNDRDSPITTNPYFHRWLAYYRYLREHPEIDNVFCVDATDVTILKNPFLYIEPSKIYCGDEPSRLGSPWMVTHNREEPLRSFIRRNSSRQLLNAGVLGGSREDIMNIALDIFTLYTDNLSKFHNDMGSFNYVLATKYQDRLEYGRKVTTVFKSYDENNQESWICHK